MKINHKISKKNKTHIYGVVFTMMCLQSAYYVPTKCLLPPLEVAI